MMRIREFSIFLLFIILLYASVFAPPTISKIRDEILFGKVTTQVLDEMQSPDSANIDIADKLSLINGYNLGQEKIVMVSQDQHPDAQQNTQDISRIVYDELEILKNSGIFPQITIPDRFNLDCSMKTYTNMERPGIHAKIWDLTFATEEKTVVSLLIDVDSHHIYQYNIWANDPLPDLNAEEISQAFAVYLGLQREEKSIKPGVVQYTTDNGMVLYQFAVPQGGNSYSIQMIPGKK